MSFSGRFRAEKTERVVTIEGSVHRLFGIRLIFEDGECEEFDDISEKCCDVDELCRLFEENDVDGGHAVYIIEDYIDTLYSV